MPRHRLEAETSHLVAALVQAGETREGAQDNKGCSWGTLSSRNSIGNIIHGECAAGDPLPCWGLPAMYEQSLLLWSRWASTHMVTTTPLLLPTQLLGQQKREVYLGVPAAGAVSSPSSEGGCEATRVHSAGNAVQTRAPS